MFKLDFPYFRLVLFLLFISLSFSSCTGNNSQRADFFRKNPLALYNAALQQSLKLNSLEGFAHLTVESPEGGFDGSARIYFQQPDSLLIQIKIGPGISLGYMLIKNEQFWMYNIRKKLLFKSKGDQVPLEELIGIKVPLPNIYDAALGLPRYQNYQLSDNSDSSALKIQYVGSNIQYTFLRNGHIYNFLADPGKGSFIKYTLVRKGEVDSIHVVFKQFRKYSGINVPKHIQVSRPTHKERLSFFYSRITVNKKMRPNRFALKVPKNIEIINLTQNEQ